MPNIEIHGMSKKSAVEMAQGLFNLFASNSFVDELVVTIFPTEVRTSSRDPQNNKAPFFRLINTKNPNNQVIIDKIRFAFMVFGNIDIEFIELAAFYPK